MEPQPNERLKFMMAYGLYLAGIDIALSLIIWSTGLIEHLGFFGSAFIGVFQIILLGFLLVFFTKKYRDKIFDGQITFGQAFSFGVILVVFSSVFTSLYSYVLNKFIDPDYMHRIMAMIQDKTYQMLSSSGLSEDQIEEQMKVLEQKGVPTPLETLVSGLEQGILGGAIMSLISSAIVKKNIRKEDDFNEAMKDVKIENE